MKMIGLPKTEVDTPALWVDLDRLEQNITTLARHFKDAGVQWRPHTNGSKIPAIAHKLMAAGAIGVTCAKVSEADGSDREGVASARVPIGRACPRTRKLAPQNEIDPAKIGRVDSPGEIG